jgi:hypothetical protein
LSDVIVHEEDVDRLDAAPARRLDAAVGSDKLSDSGPASEPSGSKVVANG